MSRSAFSLVELSIVLVILGLLTGGILSGQSLIRASELRAATAEFERYRAATQSFRDKYFAIPGDMANADKFWGYEGGSVASCTAVYAGTTPRTGTCDGDGNGSLDAVIGNPSQSGEIFQYWKQLALAGLIEGSYTGFAGPANGFDGVISVNGPRSRLNNAGWGAQTISNFAGNGIAFAYDYGSYLSFGAQISGAIPQGSVLKPEEAWNIDTKLDDGKPGTGSIISTWSFGCTDAASQNGAATANYNLSSQTVACGLYLVKAF